LGRRLQNPPVRVCGKKTEEKGKKEREAPNPAEGKRPRYLSQATVFSIGEMGGKSQVLKEEGKLSEPQP